MLTGYFSALKKNFISVSTTVSLLVWLGGTPQPAKSAILTLADDNSIVAIDPASSDGALLWLVDDVNHLFQRQFWYRVGSEGGEKSIDTLNLLEFNQPLDNQLDITYTSNDFEVVLNSILDGASENTGEAKLYETIKIKNTSFEPLPFQFFEYTDFDLTEIGEDDTIDYSSNSVMQFDNSTFAVVATNPVPERYDGATFPSLLDSLEDDTPTTLAGSSGALTGDTNFASQWNFVLEPGEVFLIDSNKFISPVQSVPESTTILGILCFGSLILLRRLLQINHN